MFNSLQVLRTTRTVTSENGATLPSNTRVVVIRMDDTTIVARVADAKLEALKGERVKLSASRVKQTFRGRPKKVTA